MVVIKELLPRLSDLLDSRREIVREALEALRPPRLVVEDTAYADSVTSEKLVLLDDLLGLVKDTVAVCMGEDDLKPGVLDSLGYSLRADVADAGDLNVLVADLRDPLHSPREILFVLHIVAHSIELSAEYHFF